MAWLKKDYSANLVANYKFNETTGTTCVDAKGSFNGVYTGTTFVVENGETFRRFNGTSDYISFSNPIIPVGKKSIRFKIRMSEKPTVSLAILSNQSAGTIEKGVRVGVATDGTLFFVEANGASYMSVVYSNKIIADNNWHNILITYDGTSNTNSVNIYVDNFVVPDASYTAINVISYVPSANLLISKHPSSTTNSFKGDLDEIEIYNEVIEFRNKKYLIQDRNNILWSVKDNDDKLIANYKLNETTGVVCTDSKGTYNGTYTGTTSITESGQTFRRFNGTSDYINFSNPVIPLGKKSIKFRIKISSIPSIPMTVFDNCLGSNAGHGIYCLVYSDGSLIFNLSNGGSFRAVLSSNNICDNVWHEVLFTWDGTLNTGMVKLYVDNLVINNYNTTATSLETVSPSQNLAIGYRKQNNDRFFKGELDDLQIYNEVIEFDEYGKPMIQADKLKDTLSDDTFINKGIADYTILNNQTINKKGVYALDKGFLGNGKLFEFDINDIFKTIDSIE